MVSSERDPEQHGQLRERPRTAWSAQREAFVQQWNTDDLDDDGPSSTAETFISVGLHTCCTLLSKSNVFRSAIHPLLQLLLKISQSR